MELGVSLDKFLEINQGKISDNKFNELILKSVLIIGKKFEEMHLINFDFTLSNFVVISDEKLKLIDVGLARKIN